MKNKLKNIRCNICSVVSHGEILTEFNDIHLGGFYPDPNGDFGYICSECHDSYIDQMNQYYLMEEK